MFGLYSGVSQSVEQIMTISQITKDMSILVLFLAYVWTGYVCAWVISYVWPCLLVFALAKFVFPTERWLDEAFNE